MTTETTYLPAEASAKEGTTVGSSLWIIWNEHGDQRAWVLFIGPYPLLPPRYPKSHLYPHSIAQTC